MTVFIFIIVSTFCFIAQDTNYSESINIEVQLQNKLMENYNPNVRPVRKPSDAVPVEFEISLNQIIEMVSVFFIFLF